VCVRACAWRVVSEVVGCCDGIVLVAVLVVVVAVAVVVVVDKVTMAMKQDVLGELLKHDFLCRAVKDHEHLHGGIGDVDGQHWLNGAKVCVRHHE
jgi:hypothetical protein